MKILYPTGTVTQFYGRNPLYLLKGAILLPTAPHAATNRDTYTVPAGRRAVITSVWLGVRRATAAAPVGLVQALAVVTQGGNSFAMCAVYLITNGVLDNKDSNNPGQVFLNAGDLLALATQDLSTGGTVAYQLTANVVEFDP